jgi:hypothetical protein
MRLASAVPGAVPAPVPQRDPSDQRQLAADHAQLRARPHRPERTPPTGNPCITRPATSGESSSPMPSRAAGATHCPGHCRPPRHQRHHGIQGRLPRRSHPSPPGLPRPAPSATPGRGIPRPQPTRNGRIPRSFRAEKSRYGNCGRAFGTPAFTSAVAYGAACTGPTNLRNEHQAQRGRSVHINGSRRSSAVGSSHRWSGGGRNV